MKKVNLGKNIIIGLFLFFCILLILSDFSLAATGRDQEKLTAAVKSQADGNGQAMPYYQKNVARHKLPFPRKAIFFNLNLGIFAFDERLTSRDINFPVYGEAGSMKQQFHLTIPLGLEINIGRYFPLDKLKLKAGLGFNAIPLKAKGNFTLSMPHPYYYGLIRHHCFSEEFNNPALLFYGFAYLVPLESWRIQLSLGPALGLATGKYPGLEDFAIEDKSPFRSSDLEVKDRVFKNSSFTVLSLGGGLNFAYFLLENMAFVMSYKWQYLKPQIDVLEQKVNLSFSRLIFCVEYSF